MMRWVSALAAKFRGQPSSAPPAPHDFPTLEEMRAMLDPRWDVTKQWDGTPAFTQGALLVTSTRRTSPPHLQIPVDDPEGGVS
jgi:hypothetical protein